MSRGNRGRRPTLWTRVARLLGVRQGNTWQRQRRESAGTHARSRSVVTKTSRMKGVSRVSSPRAFISFDFDHDEAQRNLFVGQSKNSATPFTIADWSSKTVLPQAAWEALIKDKINKCHMVIVLVGRSMSSATGVAKEIAFARDLDIPVFGFYVDGAGTTAALPAGLARNRVIPWTWPGVASAINQMMGEGKNRGR